MREHHPARNPRPRLDQGLTHVTEDQPLRRRHAIRMRGDLALADIDVALGKEGTQVVVGAAVTEPELEYDAVQVAGEVGGAIEAGARRLQAQNKAVEPAHAAGAASLFSRRRCTSDKAVRSWLLVNSRRCASSRMIETAMFGNSRTMRMNGSLAMRSVTRRHSAFTVAVRGTSHRIAISPTISFAPRVAMVIGPLGVLTMIPASPSMIR